jgi:hypothetical protein
MKLFWNVDHYKNLLTKIKNTQPYNDSKKI